MIHRRLVIRFDMPARESKRNAQRLLKLVNTLLEYAWVEGGRTQARFMSPDQCASIATFGRRLSDCEPAGAGLWWLGLSARRAGRFRPDNLAPFAPAQLDGAGLHASAQV